MNCLAAETVGYLPSLEERGLKVIYHRRKMVRLTYYFKEGCWLCDSAEEMLNGFKERYDIQIKKVAIDSDDELYEMYRFDIPVFEFKDGSTLNGRIKRNDFFKKLEENKE